MKHNDKNVFTLKLLLVLVRSLYFSILANPFRINVWCCEKKAKVIHFPFTYAYVSMSLVIILHISFFLIMYGLQKEVNVDEIYVFGLKSGHPNFDHGSVILCTFNI